MTLREIKMGFPNHIDAEDLNEIDLEEWLIGDKDSTFILRVKGDNMVEAGILNGDYVIVERNKEAKKSDIVLVESDGSWVLKYFKNNLNIAAVVVAVIRKYGK